MPRNQYSQTGRLEARKLAQLSKKKSWNRVDAEEVIRLWRQSGLSRAAFAREHKLPPHRLKYWSDRIEPDTALVTQEQSPVMELHPIQLNPAEMAFGEPAGAKIQIVTPAGLRIEVSEC